MIARACRLNGTSWFLEFFTLSAGSMINLRVKIDLAPSQLADFIAPLTCEQKQTYNVTKTVVAKSTPQLAQFILR
jgi:hypothetical protein